MYIHHGDTDTVYFATACAPVSQVKLFLTRTCFARAPVSHVKLFLTCTCFTQVMIYCDLHGHSRKQNVFMYGCNLNEKRNGVTSSFNAPEHLLKERLFPWLMAARAPDKFSFRGCKFAVRKSKEATGRVVMFKQLNISNSFTMEATFCGTNICRCVQRCVVFSLRTAAGAAPSSRHKASAFHLTLTAATAVSCNAGAHLLL